MVPELPRLLHLLLQRNLLQEALQLVNRLLGAGVLARRHLHRARRSREVQVVSFGTGDPPQSGRVRMNGKNSRVLLVGQRVRASRGT